jgi:ubiquinol-cytochrome c reductase cytochrome b subunit
MAQQHKNGWVEERLGLRKPWGWFLDRKVPRTGWLYTLGSATMIVFVIQVLTGIFLMFNYSPSPDHAYDSISYIMTNVTFGALIRGIHFYAASAMVILVILHVARVFFMAAYKYPRELTWVVGVGLLLLVLGSSFTGYLLPWDQRAYWATNVASGIAGEVPFIGHWVQSLLIGGAQIGTVTLTRFFTFHVMVIPALTAMLIGIHLFMVVRQGISASPGKIKGEMLPGQPVKEAYEAQYEASKKDGESFFPGTVSKDAIMAVVVVGIIMALAIFLPHHSEAPADPTSTTYNPRPEWYFLFFFEFLKLFPGSLEPVAAVLVPALAFLLLLAVPFLSRGFRREWSKRKLSVGIGAAVVVGLLAFELAGAMSAPGRQATELTALQIEGQRVYKEVNCGYCHTINGIGGAVGPDLSNIASTLTPDRITAYLTNPDAMVPNTLHPKLQFTPEELNGLTAYLSTLGAPVNYSDQAPVLYEKYCGTCHVVNGEGGTIGPDLTDVGSRHPVTFIESFIRDPESVVSGATMPAFHDKLTQDQITDIASYLYSLKNGSPTPTPTATTTTPTMTPTSSHTATTTPSATATTTTPGPTATIDTDGLYGQYCAVCHGDVRQGGFGPALTPDVLAGRSTAELTTVISEGEDTMPGFSVQLTPEEIDALVDYLETSQP